MSKKEKTTIEFPANYPENLKPTAEKYTARFKKSGHLPIYERFICASEMETFWSTVDKRLPLEPSYDGIARYTVCSIFGYFHFALTLWDTGKPDVTEGEYDNQWTEIQKQLSKLEELYDSSSKFLKFNLETYFEEALAEKLVYYDHIGFKEEAMKNSFKDTITLMKKSIELRSRLPSMHDRWPRKINVSENDLKRTYFTDVFIHLVLIAFGKDKANVTGKIFQAVMYDDDIEDSVGNEIGQSYSAIKKRTKKLRE